MTAVRTARPVKGAMLQAMLLAALPGLADHESRDQFFPSPVGIPVHVRYFRPDGILYCPVRGVARYAVKRFCM